MLLLHAIALLHRFRQEMPTHIHEISTIETIHTNSNGFFESAMSDHISGSFQTGHGSVIARHLKQTLTVWNESYFNILPAFHCYTGFTLHLQFFHLHHAHHRLIFNSWVSLAAITCLSN